MKMSKEDGYKIGLGSLAAAIVTIGSLLTFAEPIVSSELSDKIKEELEPVSQALETVIVSNVEGYRRAVQALRYKRDMCGNDFSCWTAQDAADLADSERNLEAAQKALEGLRETR